MSNKTKSEIKLFKIKSLLDIVLSIIIFDTVLISISLLFDVINLFLWLAIVVLLLFIALLLYFYYVRPIRNFKSKGKNLFDVHLISLCVAFLVFGAASLPCFDFLFTEINYNYQNVPALVSFSASTIFLLFFIVRWFRTHKEGEIHQSSKYLSDYYDGNLPHELEKAIIYDKASTKDIFNKESLVEEIYSALMKYNGNDKTVIGITGKWGSGKSTYLNLALDKIRASNNDSIIVNSEFSAWKYNDEKSFLFGILNCIYDSLGLGLSDFNISSSIARYVNIFLKNDRLHLLDSIALNRNDSSIINIINEYLTSNDKHILFVIDNIDRLNANEMRFVYKTVGDILDIKNITFVCLYDEEYVERIINGKYPCNYLDKIIDIKINVNEPTPNKLYNVFYTVLSNFCQKYSGKICIDPLTTEDADLLKAAFPFIDNARSVIILLNDLFNKATKKRFDLCVADYVAASIIKSTNSDLYRLISSNPSFFVRYHTYYASNDYSLLTKEERQEKRKRFLDENFGTQGKFSNYKNLIEKLFPHSLSIYDSVSNNEQNEKATLRKICDGKFFANYFRDIDANFGTVYSAIEKAMISATEEKVLFEIFHTLFSAYVDSDHIELLKIIEEEADYSDLKHLKWALKYFRLNYFSFDDTFYGFDLNPRSRVAIIIDKILRKISFDDAVNWIKSFESDYNSITLLAHIFYWNKASMDYHEGGNNLIESIGNLLGKLSAEIIDHKIDMFCLSTYRRGTLWRLLDHSNKDVLRGYLSNTINVNNVYAFLCEFIGEGTSTNKDKPYIVSIDKNNLKELFNLNDLRLLLEETTEETIEKKVIKSLVLHLLDNSTNHYEEEFNKPLNLWKSFETKSSFTISND